MKWCFAGIALLVLSFHLSGCAYAPTKSEADLYIIGPKIIDTSTGELGEPSVIAIAGDRIVDITQIGQIQIPDGAETIEIEGYAIPGLWDMHVHVLSNPEDAFERTLPLFVANGILGVRDMGTKLETLREFKDRLREAQNDIIPRVIASGPLLDGVKIPYPGYPQLVLKTPEEARSQLPVVLEAGAEFFKIYDNLSPETYREVLTYAEERGIKVTGHIPNGMTLAEVAQAGQDSIEHAGITSLKGCLPQYRSFLGRSAGARFGEAGWSGHFQVMLEAVEAFDWAACDEAFSLMAAEGTYFTPTLVMEFTDRSHVDEASFKFMTKGSLGWCETNLNSIDAASPELIEEYLSFYSRLMARVREKKVRVLAGTDTQNFCVVPGASLHWEMERLVDTGYSPLEALQAATLVPAQYFGNEKSAGQVRAGYDADLVILQDNPIENITATRSVKAVVRQGTFLSRQDLDVLEAKALQAVQKSYQEP